MTKISLEQLKMLEELTGLQHTRTGQVRRTNRTRQQTIKMGLPDPLEQEIMELKKQREEIIARHEHTDKLKMYIIDMKITAMENSK